MTAVHRDQFVSTVLANIPLCREHFRLVLSLPEFPPTEPGQFIQISCRDLDVNYSPECEFDWQPGQPLEVEGRELMSPLAMLRRPFSLAGRRDGSAGVELDIIHRIVGVGTNWLSQLRAGDRVHILGPLGNRFTLPRNAGRAILVGGGVGIPPMLYLAERLAGRNAVAFCGALSRDLLPLQIRSEVPPPDADSFEPLQNIEEFARHGIASVITTDDGSFGFRGYVTQALEKYLDEKKPEARSQMPEGSSVGSALADAGAFGQTKTSAKADPTNAQSTVVPTIYTCGPEPMMKRVAEIAAARGLSCQIAVERAMACGMGTCQSCCIRVRKPPATVKPGARDWAYRLACTDGPVFLGADLLW